MTAKYDGRGTVAVITGALYQAHQTLAVAAFGGSRFVGSFEEYI